MKRMTASDRVLSIVNYLVLGILSFMCLYPFIYMLALSFNTGMDTMRGGITFYPRDFTLGNYITVINQTNILGAYRITILRTVIGTFTSVFVTALTAYGLSEKKLPGRKLIMIYMLIPMFFSGGLIPSYLAYKDYHLLNSFWIYILPGIFNIWNCIVMKSCFMQISPSLKEAVRIDGGNEFHIFVKIIFPLSLPTFAAIALFVAVGHWNEWFTGAYYITDLELKPVQTFLQSFMAQNSISALLERGETISTAQASAAAFDQSKTTAFSVKMAAVVIGTAPILVVYPFLQKSFVKGVMIGGIKE